MATEVDIANSALVKLGATPILSLNDDTKSAELLKVRFAPARQTVSRMHPWKCLRKRVVLAPLSDLPAFGFTKQFQLPSDCLRVLPEATLEGLRSTDWQVEGRKLLYSSNTLALSYIADIEDVSQFDSMLAEVLALYLAKDIAYPLVQNETLTDRMEALFREALRQAKHYNATEGGVVVIENETFIDAHIGGDRASNVDPINTPTTAGDALTLDGETLLLS